MARIVSTTTSGTPTDPTGGLTLDALLLRQKELADRQTAIQAPRQMTSPWQGAAALAQQFVNSRQEATAADQLTAGRQRLAQIVAGADPETGSYTPQQIAEMGTLDPQAAIRAQESVAQFLRDKRAREAAIADREDTQAFQHGETVAGQAFQTGNLQQQREWQVLDDKTRRGEVLSDAETARKAELDKFNRTPLTEVGKIDAELAAGRISPEEATTAKAALAPESFRPPTQAEIEAYGLKPDQPVRISTKTGKPEAIGGGPSVQLLPSEVGAKLGLADEFLSNFDSVRSEAASGSMTGAIDQPMTATLGRGSGGTAYRQLRQGTEGLVRLMTGAGMPASEAADKAKMYEPVITDDADTLVNKIDGLKAAILRVRSGATAGRAFPEAPESKAAPTGLPTPQTPADFAALKPGDHYIDPDDNKEYVK